LRRNSVRLDFDVRSSNLKKGKRPIKNPKQKPLHYITGYGFWFTQDSSLQQRRRRIYGKERETINLPDRTARNN